MFNKLLLSFTLCILTQIVLGQNVGIGIVNPTEILHVDNGNIKIGQSIWNSSLSHALKFGDGNYCVISEVGDDLMELHANQITLKRSNGGSTQLNLIGSLQINDGLQGTGKLLTSNADGLASWQSPPSANTGFYVSRTSGNQVIPSGAYYKVSFPSITFSDGGLWSGVNNEYTAPTTGTYFFDTRIYLSPNGYSGAKSFRLAICVNNTPVHYIDIFETYVDIFLRKQHHLSGLVKCNASDKVSVQFTHDTGVDQGITMYGTGFSGYRAY